MDEQIEIKAETLDEAWEKLKKLTPDGYFTATVCTGKTCCSY